MQTDPIGYKDHFNLYAYVGDDPVNNEDSSGMCTGSLIENGNGTCRATGGFTTGVQGIAQGMAIATAAHEAVSALLGKEAPEQSKATSQSGAAEPAAERLKREALDTPRLRASMEKAWVLSMPFSSDQRRINEHGFYIHRDKGELTAGRMLVGVGNTFDKRTFLGPGMSDLAFFHTHPFGNPWPQGFSDADEIIWRKYPGLIMIMRNREGYFAQ